MDFIRVPLQGTRNLINNSLASREPWQIVTITSASVLYLVWLHGILTDNECVTEKVKKTIFRWMKVIPHVKRLVDSKLESINESFEEDVKKRTAHLKYITDLPQDGLTDDQILNLVNENLQIGDIDWRNGCVSGAVYVNNNNLAHLVTEVYGKTSYTNPLHPDVFPGVCKMEAEVVRIAANLFNGDSSVCGTTTSGGTESILMACKAWRDYGREVKGIRYPEMILPTTAHAAFDKACQYFKIRARYIHLDPNTTKVNVKAVKRAINGNTILIVGSAPNYPYGTMDDIEELSNLGLKYDVPVHVDSCIGGFLTAFMDDAGYPIATCDFRLPGVKSISADTHKYGFAPKGSSIILYRNKSYRQYQYTVTTDWPGGVYGSPTVSGSRAGANIAVCWATLLSFGKEGYVKATKDIIYTARYIEKGLRRIKNVFVFGQPATSIVAFGSNDFDIYRLSDSLTKRGWSLNPLQFPSGIHICVTHLHTQPGVADRFLKDVQECVDEIMKSPEKPAEGKMAIYGVAQTIPDRSIVSDFTKLFLDSLFYIPKK